MYTRRLFFFQSQSVQNLNFRPESSKLGGRKDGLVPKKYMSRSESSELFTTNQNLTFFLGSRTPSHYWSKRSALRPSQRAFRNQQS
jgi:hypothetical protein